MNSYTVISNLDAWEVEVFDGIPREVAQWIADRLGVGVDYIQAVDVAELTRRAWRVDDGPELLRPDSV